jgi:hypothetical protein
MENDITKEFLVSELYRWIEEHNNKIPARDEIKKLDGYPCAYQFFVFFGTKKWNEVLDMIGIKPKNKLWTEIETDYIRHNWTIFDDVELAKKLNRTVDSIRYKRLEMELTKQEKTKWQEWEKEYLIQNYYNGDKEKICETLKKEWSIIKDCANNLKLKRIKGKYLLEGGKLRVCKYCKQTFPNTEEYFYKSKKSFTSYCIQCDKKIREQKQREKGIITNTLKNDMFINGYKYCGKCKTWKNIGDFYLINNDMIESYADLHRWCIDCERLYYLKNQVKLLLSEFNSDLSTKEIDQIIEMFRDKKTNNQIMCDLEHYNIEGELNIIYKYLLTCGTHNSKMMIASDTITMCHSIEELIITELLIQNHIIFDKNISYSKYIKSDNTKRTFDWVITINNEK